MAPVDAQAGKILPGFQKTLMQIKGVAIPGFRLLPILEQESRVSWFIRIVGVLVYFYSEDLDDGRQFGDVLVVNPFSASRDPA